MAKFRIVLYAPSIYAEVVVEAGDRDEALQRAGRMSGSELASLDWKVTDDALQPARLSNSFSIDHENIDRMDDDYDADIPAA